MALCICKSNIQLLATPPLHHTQLYKLTHMQLLPFFLSFFFNILNCFDKFISHKNQFVNKNANILIKFSSNFKQSYYGWQGVWHNEGERRGRGIGRSMVFRVGDCTFCWLHTAKSVQKVFAQWQFGEQGISFVPLDHPLCQILVLSEPLIN